MGHRALGGDMCRIGNYWKWDYGGDEQLDIGVASSGQKANRPLVLLAPALFSWRKVQCFSSDFALHVEEPEIHLHPDDQVAMDNILAYLVNNGFRVLDPTHSLTILYTLNNLLAASVLPSDVVVERLPTPEVRLKTGKAGAYWFGEDGVVRNLADGETGLISETELANVDETLAAETNRIEVMCVYGA